MRAAVLKASQFSVEELPDPEPARGQILLKPLFTGICGSDLHLREMLSTLPAEGPSAPPAFVLGHEFSAEVLAIGPDTQTAIKPGDRITPNPFTRTSCGYDLVGLSPERTGGLASLCVVEADNAIVIPNSLASDLAALTEPLAVGMHAANMADRNRGPNLVIGCGPVGLSVILALKAQGRGPILAADFSPERRRAAELLGADIIVDPAESSPYERWSDLAFNPLPVSPLLPDSIVGRPAGVNIFECVGAPGVIDQVLKQAPQHSHIIVVGVCVHEDKLMPQDAILREVGIEFCLAYTRAEFSAALNMIADHPEQVAIMVTSRLPLAETTRVFDELSGQPSEIKILINPQC